MGKLHLSIGYLLGLLCAAAAAFPAVASASALSVDVSPTTGYSVTNRTTAALPPRTTSGPIATYNPTLGPLAGGGAYQTTSTGITITGIKGNVGSTTMSGRVNVTAAAMRNALTRCLTSFRCNAATMAGSAGIQGLFNGIDYILGEGGQILRRDIDIADSQLPWYCPSLPRSSFPLYAPNGSIHTIHDTAGFGGSSCPAGQTLVSNCTSTSLGYYPNADGFWPFECRTTPGQPLPPPVPVPPKEIPSLVDSSYNPDPSDLPYLSTGGLDFSHPGVDFEIVDIPSITGANAPSSIITQNPDGSSKGTYSEFKFNWTGPSKQPKVSVDETTTETTYSPTGEPTGTTTTTTSSGGAAPPAKTPTDCDFMPTVCRFIDWFTEPDPELNQDVDFTQLIDDVDVDREFSVGSSTAACPAPFVVNLSWVPSVEVSLQPFCDFADLLRPVLLAIASIFSGMIILRT